ncbi:synaptotagmin-like protein 4 isoform X2 [Trematomus bernacchii]|uniref:synaptotagmin-like protein 4 isoform X2 n=1 Tax=Trematomus bernacchii TaxID=40690 RepID=UPI00146BF464|nr:synaptotagmin-like protein 4 isoform X2 [Trematomus bernacchii]
MPEAADMINLNLAFLSDSERERILEVLQRDEELRQAEELRVRSMKTELLEVKRKGAKRGSGKYSQHSCGRCQDPLSRLTVFSSQCKICNHHLCRNCRIAIPDGSWVCSVCAKETDLKKRTGDWFYDQRVNRFSMTPGHDLVRVSLKKRPMAKKRETTGEVLLRSTDINPDLPIPVPRVRQKNQVTDNNGRESLSGSTVSSLTAPVKADIVTEDSANSEVIHVPEIKTARVSPSPDMDVDRLFKKSIKRGQKPPETISTLDLREGCDTAEVSMGNRRRSVPVLEIQEDGEEEEDIDSLVSFHKRSMVSSSYSLHSSKSTLGSLMSIYSEAGDFDSVEVSGDLVFSMSYNEPTQSLHVFIKECHGLAYGNASGQLSHPYVKCYLLPDKSRQSKKKTSIKRNTVDPVYNETLKYSISRSQLFTRSMLISVWHHGRLSRNAFLGEVEIPLDSRDLDSPHEENVALMAKSASAAPASAFAQYKGELVISLKYVTPEKPTSGKKGKKAEVGGSGELHVLIKEANNLMAMKPGGTSDSFVKGYLFPTKAKNTKKKTPVVKKNLNPSYDHTFVYKDVALEQLQEMCLELTVWDREAMGSNEFLGGLRLSSGTGTVKIGKAEVEMDSLGEEVSLWEKMMKYPDSWAEGTLPLRSTMVKAK